MKILNWLEDFFGCGNPPDSLAWKIYNRLAGQVTCICCVFFRGIFIGIALGVILFYLFGV